MARAPGARLGPYEILAPLGAGGMGEVDKARDTRLNRSVAVPDLAGVRGIPALYATPDASTIAFAFTRILSDPFLADGLR